MPLYEAQVRERVWRDVTYVVEAPDSEMAYSLAVSGHTVERRFIQELPPVVYSVPVHPKLVEGQEEPPKESEDEEATEAEEEQRQELPF